MQHLYTLSHQYGHMIMHEKDVAKGHVLVMSACSAGNLDM